MNQITAIGIDLGKSVFYVHAVDRRGKAVERRRVTRKGLRRYMLRVAPAWWGWRRAEALSTGRAG